MSLPSLTAKTVCCTLLLALTACFRPLYGPTASGEQLADVLAAIQVEPINAPVGQERFGHFVRSEVVYAMNGSGLPHKKKYKLILAVSESVQTPVVDTTTGRADAATLSANTSFTLTTLDGRLLLNGTANATASYNRDPQRFASVRAARDAETRVAKTTAEQIKTRVASILATAP